MAEEPDSQGIQRLRSHEYQLYLQQSRAAYERRYADNIAQYRARRELEEYEARWRVEHEERITEELTELVGREKRFCHEDCADVEFSLVGGIEAHFFPGPEDDQTVVNSVMSFVRDLPKFYVGGTTSPAWRWGGGMTDRSKTPMRGHRESWQLMKVVALRQGEAAGVLESALIRAARERYPTQLTNTANDSRGLSKSGFCSLYIVY